MNTMKIIVAAACLTLLLSVDCTVAETIPIRIGILASGTVEWEMAVLQDEPATRSADFELVVQRLANAEAGKIALQAGSVDMIVSDWIWVSRLRSTGADFTFHPYSSTSGALIVQQDSPIRTISDLEGRRLGIAGGELDKNWLLLRALALQDRLDLNAVTEKVFGAPPLINEQLKRHRIDAALNYWHFAARLEAQGYRQVIDGRGLLKGLGIQENVPALGFVFKQRWALDHKKAVNHFFNASLDARKKICSDDAVWQKVLPLIKADDPPTQTLLRRRYCEGVVDEWSEAEQRGAERVYAILHGLSDNKLTGPSERLQPGTFWSIED
ncbi:MAG: ABC transporter substrate-binding protein [Gammaproteobacteria bacterium]